MEPGRSAYIAKICIKTNLNRREFVPGSLFAEADHFLQPKVIRPDQLLQLKLSKSDPAGSLFTRINFCVTVPISCLVGFVVSHVESTHIFILMICSEV